MVLKKIKLKDISDNQINSSEMGKMFAGVNSDVMLMAYGCDHDVCSNDKSGSRKDCTVDTCKSSTCTTGA